MTTTAKDDDLTLVLGGTGKTGRRVAERLKAQGRSVRIGARSAVPSFDWNNEAGWDAALRGVSAIYITYAPDLAMPGATDAITALTQRARHYGVRKLVLLSGRGEEEAQAAERIVQNAGLDWSIVRASWFNQNFSEGAFVDMVRAGAITLPAGHTPEPFVDADDIADVVVASLTDDRHNGQLYELTGPRLMTLADVASDLSAATGREITYTDVPHDAFVAEADRAGAPKDVVWMLDYLFSTVLDGRNAHLTDGVQRALGRPPKDFSDYARDAATTGVWSVAA
ncbi:NAD(P)H-binding protein [Parvularcula lutaonensis]|uniref:NAD(P)H-binding protein n=1 Tax=Parvularcula lutaonensis TaxID=491923 RepID=A0ABV7MDC4_9PROT|nr:NAD(P)H-binding protein [Parvularcula lutaonensis]GGY52887.1 NmrA family transcriptional regulator [Parvularcula lutaonensis]